MYLIAIKILLDPFHSLVCEDQGLVLKNRESNGKVPSIQTISN